MAFSSDTLCSPYIVSINGEKDIHVNLENEYNHLFKRYYHYTDINFATRGTEKLSKVPPIYLNNKYLGDECEIESDGYSIRCRIKDYKWYEVDEPKPVVYKVNELYEGCYGPVFTGITLYVSGESLYINMILLLLIILILL